MKQYRHRKITKYSKAALLSSAALLLASCKYVPIKHYFAEKGTDGDDVMGGEQQNEFVSSAGADTITGSDRGNGIVYYDNSPSAVEIDLLNNVADGGYADGDVLINISRLFGSEFDDILLGNESNNDIEGEAGNDTIEGRGGKDQLWGNAGDDKISGGDGDDE